MRDVHLDSIFCQEVSTTLALTLSTNVLHAY